MVNGNSNNREFGDYSENDLKSFTNEPYIDYATGEFVDESAIRHPSTGIFDLELAERNARSMVQGFEGYLKAGTVSASDVINLFKSDESFASVLKNAFAQAGYKIEPDVQDAELSDQPGPHLPIAAPRLWANRNKEVENNPSEFFRAVYAEWLPYLARQDLLRFDKPLYVSYAQWVRPERHPEDKIDFATGYANSRIGDPNEAIERRRASVRAASARLRERRKSGQDVADCGSANTISPFADRKP